MSKEITGALFKQMILHGAAAITAQKQAINDLNVFPVPDGDTGTNMSMTIATAAEALRKAAPASVGQASSVTASALLQGARGNSGVILSLLFRGLSKALKGMETADAAAFAAAMQEGVAAAYKAVMKPAEGTVLTVSRLAAKRAADTAAEGADVEATLAAAIEEGYDALAQTTDMNPVLKKAGVVDAGGKGYLLILEGMLAELRGEPIPENVEEAETHKEKADFNAMAQEEITFTFDTVYVVRKAREDIDLMPLRAYLSSIGDSLVIGEDDETFKVHVHTDIPGAALTESQKYGTLELAKIENMRSQADALAAGQTAQSTDDLDAIEEELENGESGHKVAAPEKAVGFLAICAGDGLAAVFRDLGCDAVVSGGQTMNPSTESILAGIDQVPAETVFVLPNNGNIIMAAQQCQGLTEKNVVVIPSKTVPQGITAMMNVDPEAEVASITEAMTEALSTVTTSQITYAARDSDFDGFEIHQGDYLALKEGKAVGFLAICAGDGLAAVFRDLGCDAVVSGGQTMNPSTESILAGIDQVPAETVFVLPNNGNIIMAAQQCQGLTEKNVVVIPSKTVPQGITAMMNVDPEAEVASITEAMTEALSTVTTSQITYAARDSDFDGFEIHQGDYLALKEGKLFGTDTQLDALLEKLAEEGKDSSFISLYYGEDVTEDAAQAAGARFQAVCPDAEISVLSGGQPVYYYIISFE